MLFASGDPVSAQCLQDVFQMDRANLLMVIEALRADFETRETGVRLVVMEDSFQLCTKDEYGEYVRAVLEMKRNTPLSAAAMEVLSIVAYHQPVSRAFVEQVRGVDCSGIIAGLVQKNLVEEKGRLELPGRPLIYGTTPLFLRCFQISELSELPRIPEPKPEETTEETAIT